MLDNAFTAHPADDSILALPDMSNLGGLGSDMDNSFPASTAPGAVQPSHMLFPPPHATQGGNSQWDLISLGLEEPLPSRDVIEELYVICLELFWSFF
jgi:hypothetical protein